MRGFKEFTSLSQGAKIVFRSRQSVIPQFGIFKKLLEFSFKPNVLVILHI